MAPTPKDHEALACLRAFIGVYGYPPSIRQLGECLEVTSTQTISKRLQRLVILGWIVREPGQPRALRIVEGQE